MPTSAESGDVPAAPPHPVPLGTPDPLHDAEPDERLPRPLFVHLAVLAAVLGTLVTIGSIGWRWYRVRFPDAVILIRGDASSDGARVTVADEDGRQVFTGRLANVAQSDGMVVLVEQGLFEVRVDRGQQHLQSARVYVRNGSGVIVNVPPAEPPGPPGPASQPTTRPAGV